MTAVFNPSNGIFNIATGGSIYHITIQFVAETLSNAGCSIHTKTPFQIIDKIGFLKSEAESLKITSDLVMDFIGQMGLTSTVSITNTDPDLDSLSFDFDSCDT